MPTQTPASRKFAPPSARSSVAAAPSSSRPAFINHLARTSQPSSSPSLRKPFPNTIKDGEFDEIDLDEPDDDHFLPRHALVNPVGHNSSSSAIGINTDGRGKKQDDQILSHATATSATKRRKVSHFVSETIDDLGSKPSSSPLPPSPSARPIEHNIHVEVPHTSPLGPSHDEPINTVYRDDDSSDSADYSPNAQDITTPKRHTRNSNPISRFKTPQYPFTPPPPPSFSNGPPPPPLDSTDATTTYHSLPSFQSRLLASSSTAANNSTGLHLRGPQPSLDFTLPDAFSPSRRRGNREYLHSGHAETVRGWILDLAARTSTTTTTASRGSSDSSIWNKTDPTSQPLSQKQDNSNGDRQKIRVEDVVVRDPAGRFLVVKVDTAEPGAGKIDIQGQRQGQTNNDQKIAYWFLTNVDQQHYHHHVQGSGVGVRIGVSNFDRVKPGVSIVVEAGEVASWTLDLGVNCGGSGGSASRTRVAVLWDFVSP